MNAQRFLDVVFGSGLVVLGCVLLLHAIVPELTWLSVTAWTTVGIIGAVIAAKGWLRQNSSRKFFGAVVAVAGFHIALWAGEIMYPVPEEVFASILIWIGLGFAFVWLSAPYKIDVLVPAALFLGPGLGYYLWWYDYVRASTLRDWASDGWPVLLVLLGAGVALRAFRPVRQ